MPRDYVVKAPIEESAWTGTNGPLAGKDMISYYFGVEGSDETHTVNRMASSDSVREGETIHAEEKGRDKAGNVKLKAVQQGGGGYGGGGGKPMDPEREKRIVRQHSQAQALTTIDIMVRGEMWMPKNPEELFEKIRKTTDWFDKDVLG